MNLSNPVTKIACSHILGEDGTLHRNGLLTFGADGTLESVEYGVENIDGSSQTRYYNGVLLPSMVNAHNHLELSYLEGVIPQGIGLVDFIRHVIRLRNDTSVAERINKLELQDAIMWLEGVGAVGDISNDPFSLEVKSRSSIFYHTFVEYFGLTAADMAVNYFERVRSVLDEAERLKITATSTPHSTYMVSDELFKRTEDSERLSVHFMETPSELGLFDKKGEMYDFVTSDGTVLDFLEYGSHPERLIASLPADKKLLLVHCTQMQPTDIKKVLGYFTDVTIVTCPRSNYYIERGLPPLDELRKQGARIAIGTDSLCSNTSYSLASEIEFILNNYKDIPLAEILVWATRNGAKALGLDSVLGSFTVGKKCGAVLLEGLDLNSLQPLGSLTSRRLL